MEGFSEYEPPTAEISFDDNNKYHVFLSFRGPDVRTKFVDHLYESLSAAGLRVFLDSEELEKGKDIDSSLQEAIEKSDILIPIFSEHYAESTWCLEEAARMCRSNGFIIPLFYDVKPCDVRYPRRNGGKFAEGFQKHYNHLDRQNESTIQSWENALHQISHRSGWTLEAESWYEAKLVKRVVEDLLITLKKNVPLDVAMHPVGLERAKLQLVESLNLSLTNITVKVGISGLGGVGKTTLAKAVYNEVHRQFQACCFLFNTGCTAPNETTLVDLQRKILRDLVNYHGEVSSVDEGKVLMRDRLRGVRALVILDDVNSIWHLHAVDGDWFGRGSRLIITSRDKHILNLAKVDSLHEMSGLPEEEALQLFSWHAFSRAFPENPFKELSTRIAEACGGISLALVVIGAHLSDKKEPDDIQCWKEALHDIGEHPDIFRVLRISYDGLREVEKEIFLDIVFFLDFFPDIVFGLGADYRKNAVTYWEALHPNKVHTAIKNLSLKMLIGASGREDRLHMHDLLRQMGRVFGNNSRVCLPMGPHRDLNRDTAEGVKMLVYRGEDGREAVTLPRMPHLRYLFVENTKLVGNIEELVPNLIWIEIRKCEFLSDNYTWMKLRNGPQLDNWSQLRICKLGESQSLTRIPNNLDRAVNLQCLDLIDCAALTALPNTLNFPHLKRFSLGGCANLKSLPSTIGILAQLEVLNLYGCTGLSILPDTIGDLAQLKALNLHRCASLQSLPDTFGKLVRLQVFDFHGCSGLGRFEDVVVRLARLRQLRCTGLGSLLEKKINIYLCCPPIPEEEREPVDRLYESLQTTSRCRRSGLEEHRSKDDHIVVKKIGCKATRGMTPNECQSKIESADIKAIFTSDIIIEVYPKVNGRLSPWRADDQRIFTPSFDDTVRPIDGFHGLTSIHFIHDGEPEPIRHSDNPCWAYNGYKRCQHKRLIF